MCPALALILVLEINTGYQSFDKTFIGLAAQAITDSSVTTRVFIGLTSTACDGNYVWDDGTPLDYTNWQPGGQPDNPTTECHAAIVPNIGTDMSGSGWAVGGWDSVAANGPYRAICWR